MRKKAPPGPRPDIDCVAWGIDAPLRDNRNVPIISPKPGRPIDVYCVSSRMTEVITHWVDGQSTPCTRPMQVCEWCEMRYGLRWKAYVGVFIPADGRVSILELTLNAVNQCKALRLAPDLRGGRVKLRRPGSRPNSAVYAEFFPYHDAMGFSKDQLPAEFNVREALMRVWFG